MAKGFPQFEDGDVEIHLSSETKLVLHSYVLALHSPWFKASLSDRWASSGNKSSLFSGEGRTLGGVNKARWIYELRFEQGSSDGFLLRQGTTTQADMFVDTVAVVEGSVFDALSANLARELCIQAYCDMFRTLYHLPPAMDDSNCALARDAIARMATVAKFYGCEHVVKLHAENHVRLHKSTVLDLCSTDSTSMLRLAVAIQSDWIFKEAASNLLGRSKAVFDAAIPTLQGLGIAELMQGKRKDLFDTLRQCEFDMLCLQPLEMEGWCKQSAVYFFRQYLTERLKAGSGSGLTPGYANVYHAIAKGSFATNNRLAVKTWMTRIFSEGTENATVAEEDINAVFKRAADVLKLVLKDVTERQGDKKDVHRSLRFIKIKNEELPWAGV